MTINPTANRAAGVIACAALAIGLTAPIAAAAAPATPQTAASTQSLLAKPKPGKSVKDLARALAQAQRAEQKARAKVEREKEDLTTAQDDALDPADEYEQALIDVDDARVEHAEAKAALDRARHVIANQGALWADWERRMSAAQAAFVPIKQAYDAAVARREGLDTQIDSLQEQQDAATTNQDDAAAYANTLTANEIPAAQARFNSAWQAEQAAWAAQEEARVAFENKKAQYPDCRRTSGYWECKVSGSWRPIPRLDELQSILLDRHASYNAARALRLDTEGLLASLNYRLAEVQATVTYWAGVAADLGNQITATRNLIPAADAAVTAAEAKMDAAEQDIEDLQDEADSLTQEILDAKSDEPLLATDERELAELLAETEAALAAADTANRAAQTKVTAAAADVTAAKGALAEAKTKVKAAKERLKKAKSKRR